MNEFKVTDYITPGQTDSETIEKCMEAASKTGTEKTVIFDGRDFFIDRAILVPENTTIVIDGCTIKQKDKVFDNVFRGANLVLDEKNPYGCPLDIKPQKNIKILGKNGAKIIGPDKSQIGYHPVKKENQIMTGDFWGWRTHMFSFSLGEKIELAGLTLSHTMGWAITFDFCRDIYIHDMEIWSNVKNGDGIDFRSGCHDCVVENISGYTSDDTIACTALMKSVRQKYPVKNYLYPSEPCTCLDADYNRDIYNIKIKNVSTGGLHHGIICLAANGNKVYNVSIEDIGDGPDGQREATVKLYTGYGSGYTAGDIHDIKVKNVTSKGAKYAFMIAADVENVLAENIVQDNPDGEKFFGINQNSVVII